MIQPFVTFVWPKRIFYLVGVIAHFKYFANQSHFAKCFRQYTGMNPKQFRNS
ncbi:AraC family transcriptional regulator [Nostoc sp. CHAB 5836]|uniref:AraC family transcriptional regulator n=1 Tax=Nostoc sp. CHAB 5836 TaxID=2780404 RepID=UPI001E420ABC|nr:AraC family transcriptional regulator [Nostoc sp. CHAB 5836]MCC5616824.1 AraC family transcriptional regulator [Nostoc sp. CHAB 5836]